MTKNFFLGILVIVCFYGLNSSVEAKGLDFSVTVIPNKEQIDGNSGYFHLLVQPDKAMDIQVEVVNLKNTEQTIDIYPVDATTAANGGIQYVSNTEGIRWNPEQISFTEIAKKQVVTLRGLEKKRVTMSLDALKKPFNGSMLGGIIFQSQSEKLSSSEEKKTLINEYSFVVAVHLQTKKEISEPKFSIKQVRTSFVDGYLRIVETLSQTTNEVLTQVTIESSIKKEGYTVKKYEKTIEDVGIAPNSNFDLYLTDSNTYKAIEVGDYEIETIIKIGSQKQILREKFSISSIEGEDQRTKDEDLTTPPYWLYFLIGMVSVVVMILIAVFCRMNIRRKK